MDEADMADDSDAPRGKRSRRSRTQRASGPPPLMRRRAPAPRDAARKATEQLSVYPIGAVVGGLALGALVGALLPRTERETKLLGKAGRKVDRRRARRRPDEASTPAASSSTSSRRRRPRRSTKVGRRRSREAVGGRRTDADAPCRADR